MKVIREPGDGVIIAVNMMPDIGDHVSVQVDHPDQLDLLGAAELLQIVIDGILKQENDLA